MRRPETAAVSVAVAAWVSALADGSDSGVGLRWLQRPVTAVAARL
jgi:hypothetical protein